MLAQALLQGAPMERSRSPPSVSSRHATFCAAATAKEVGGHTGQSCGGGEALGAQRLAVLARASASDGVGGSGSTEPPGSSSASCEQAPVASKFSTASFLKKRRAVSAARREGRGLTPSGSQLGSQAKFPADVDDETRDEGGAARRARAPSGRGMRGVEAINARIDVLADTMARQIGSLTEQLARLQMLGPGPSGAAQAMAGGGGSAPNHAATALEA